MKYFWSDTHFGHVAILKYQDKTRRFDSVEAMNEAMVMAWNGAVRPVDEIYFLGDFSFEKDPSATFGRLNGHKHLVVGNHDENRKAVMDLPWASVHTLVTVKENGVRAVCCHYPLESWSQAHHGSLMLHGHTHGSLKRVIPHRFDVGVDCFIEPISLADLAAVASTQVFEPTDHHA
jgi:calcineurin-like phosphoesterase family protein